MAKTSKLARRRLRAALAELQQQQEEPIMPMPTPKPDESEKDFMGRCMADETMQSEFPDESQRAAVCRKQFGGEDKATARTWYTIANKAESPDEAEVMIYDEIGGFGITAAKFVGDIKAIKASTIRLRINSPGGAVTEASAIYNAIKEHPARVIVHVDGLAASSGSVIAMSGDEVQMADNAFLMIHEAHVGVMGDSADLKRYADLLDKMNDNIAGAYQKKSGKPKSHWRKLMSDETWFSAKEAKAEGLADAVYAADKPIRAAAFASGFDFTAYNKVPDAVWERFGAKEVTVNIEPVAEPVAAATEIIQTSSENAPEAEPRGEAAPVAQIQETPTMADNSTTAAPAQTPAAGTGSTPQGEVARLNEQTIQAYVDKGRAVGFAEGKRYAEERMRKLMAVCPGKAHIAVNAFLSGHDEQMVKMLVDAETAADAKAREKTAEMEVQIARLQAQLATGGYPIGVAMNPTQKPLGSPTAVPAGMDPEAQANLEWETDPMIRAQNNEKTWKLYRVQQLRGNVRVLAKSA